MESAEALADGRVARPDRLDCSGFVLAAYREAGRPLAIPDRFTGRSGSEAGMLLAWARSERRLVTTPRPGDLAFFRNTYGPGDGRITHVALVEKVDPDGEVELLHVLGRGVCRSRMNVDRPGDPALNSWLRKKAGAADRLPKLAGELFVAYARFD